MSLSTKLSTLMNDKGLLSLSPTPDVVVHSYTRWASRSCLMSDLRSTHALLAQGLLYLAADHIYLIGGYVVLRNPSLASVSAMLSWDDDPTRSATVHLEDSVSELVSQVKYHGAKSFHIPFTNTWIVKLLT